VIVGKGKGYDNDNISHYLLRIAYSKTKELREWFTRSEAGLFKLRMHQMANMAGMENFVKNFLQKLKDHFGRNDFPFDIVTLEEKKALIEQDEDIADYIEYICYDKNNKSKSKDLIKVWSSHSHNLHRSPSSLCSGSSQKKSDF
jgi:DNA primase large subunit